jgi:hypothetical protein
MLKLPLVHGATISLCPSTLKELKIYLLSDKEDVGTKLSVTGLIDAAVQTSQLCPRGCVVAVCDSDWYIGCISAHNDEECDSVKFMERKG